MIIFKELKLDRNELSGAFGDIGTDFPLVIGIVIATGIDSASALIMFGVMQIISGLCYRIPLSVQPLKAFAAIIISQKIPGNIMFAGGLAIGISMFLLSISGIITHLGVIIPKCVVRGIQFGLGLQLSILALKNYIASDFMSGYLIGGIAFIVGIFLIGNRKYPPALLMIFIGILYNILSFKMDIDNIIGKISFSLPELNNRFTINDIIKGFLILALPQIPLSIGNSILATVQTAKDYFPDKNISFRKIGITYSLMNLINPFFGGIPTCHGSGGIAGHYSFGARTAGSVIIYGSMFLAFGLFFSQSFQQIISFFPLPILGVILLFESVSLIILIKDIIGNSSEFMIAVIVGLISANLPYGFAISIPLGLIVYYGHKKLSQNLLLK